MTHTALPVELQALEDALDAAERDARALAGDLTPVQGVWRTDASSWSVAECFDHLATANRVYLTSMRPSAERALREGRTRRRPALPGLVGSWFVNYLEPPVKPRLRSKAPRTIRPRSSPAFDDAFPSFLASHDDVRTFLLTYSGLDLSRIRFPNPFIPGVRFSLATGLHVLAAHERRHLWQARRVAQAARSAKIGDQG